jgi:hypothetical protein
MRALVPLATGCGPVVVVAIVSLVIGWVWTWFAIANGAVSVLLLVLFRGSVTGADERRPPGRACVGRREPDWPAAATCGRRRRGPPPGAPE